MALSLEWQHRIESWENALWEQLYHPCKTITVEMFTTNDQLRYDEARTRKFERIYQGERWGERWQYGWFRGSVEVPVELMGKRVVLRPDAGGEGLVWVNGQLVGAVDWAHQHITLTRSANVGERYEFIMEIYAGHAPVIVRGGPARDGKYPGSKLMDGKIARVGEISFGEWDEEMYQLAINFSTLVSLRKNLPDHSLRKSEVDQALMQVTRVVDVELPRSEQWEGICEGQKILEPVLQCVNGSTVPQLYAIGHAHLDVAWLWPLAETERKIARTLGNTLTLLEEYPEYRYIQSQPHLFWMLKELYPELYVRVKQAISDGRIIADGGMWVEADTNISGGEALIRQILYGKQWFQDEYGIDSRILWLPDVFGYSGALPQILVGCNMEGFFTQKITWIYNGGDPFPFNTFMWEGIDGSQILTHIFYDYNTFPKPADVQHRWENRIQKNNIKELMLAFGHGDGGGGPTRDHLEYLQRLKDLEGAPRVRMAAPKEMLDVIRKRGLPKEKYVGELYFQAHRGTYTSQARTKRGNRKSEAALRELELWSVVAERLTGRKVQPEKIDVLWKKVLLNQFHDIIPGSSIRRVYVEAEQAYQEVLSQAKEETDDVLGTLVTETTDSVVLFNSLNWERSVLLELTSDEGKKDWVEVTVPACGWTSVSTKVDSVAITDPVKIEGLVVENRYLQVKFNEMGEMISCIDKETGFEILDGKANQLCLYKDVPVSWDAWDVDSMLTEVPAHLSTESQIEVITNDPVMVVLRVHRNLSTVSSLVQDIILRRNSRRIDFRTKVDWHERHKMLKVAFPVNLYTTDAVHEIQYGHIRRPNHASRQFDADRFEVCNHKWTGLVEENRGAAVLNDCKYGINVKGNTMMLSLLRSPIAPDEEADQGEHEFTYAFYCWNGSFSESNVIPEAYDLNIPVVIKAGQVSERSLFHIDAKNIIVEAVKPAIDQSGDIIIRLYEASRSRTKTKLTSTLNIQRVFQTDMLENIEQELVWENDGVELEFRPFEIKTLRLH